MGEATFTAKETNKKSVYRSHLKRTSLLNVISEELTRINPHAAPGGGKHTLFRVYKGPSFISTVYIHFLGSF